MRRELLHIYGPFSIYSFGVALAVGLLVFIKAVQSNPRFKKLNLENKFAEILLLGTVVAVAGGRILYVISEPNALSYPLEIFAPWKGGLSLLGGVIAVLAVMPWYLERVGVPAWPFFDLIAIYTPLLQAISRFGCFSAGCCHGCPTDYSWGYTYTNADSVAPTDIALHPAQIYSAIALFGIFAVMYGFLQHRMHKPGQLTTAYLMLASIERFIVDFFRGDRTMFTPFLSISQTIAVILFAASCIVFTRISFTPAKSKS